MIAHPSLTLLSHPFSREDLFLVVYCLVDDWMHARYGQSNAPRKRRGPRPDAFSDAEVLTGLLVGELSLGRRERAWLRQGRASYRARFPTLPEASRFARRATAVRELLRLFRQEILFWADADRAPLRRLDSFPMPLCACYRIRQSTLPISGAPFGYNRAQKPFYHGLHPPLLIPGSGFSEDVILAPGNCNDAPALACSLDECVEQGRTLMGPIGVLDKGYIRSLLVAWAREHLGLTLLVRPRDRKGEEANAWQPTLDRVRKPIEGVGSVLTECFGIEHVRARTDLGIDRRANAKATAFSLARYFNRALGREPMDIVRYAV